MEVGDARPERDKKGWNGTRLFCGCECGVLALGDDEVPGRIERLNAALSAGAGVVLAHKAVVVEHYGLYLNMLAQTQGGIYAQTYGPKCSREKMSGGWFSSWELTTPWSPLSVEMTVTVDERPFTVHKVFSPPKNLPGGEPQGLIVASYIVMARANADLVRQILAAYPIDSKGGK